MVKKLASISIVAGAAAITACFGAGPTPSPPSKATILFTGAPIMNCGQSGTYIGPVAIGAGSGFVSMLPYTQSGGGFDCNGGGGPPPSQDESIFAFNKDGGTLTKIGSAGQSNQSFHAKLTTTPTGVAYVYASQSTNQAIVDPGNIMVGSNMGGVTQPLGIAQVGSDLYVEITNNGVTTGQAEPDNPEYPCCGGGSGGTNNQMANIYKVGAGGAVVAVNAVCNTLDACMVGNANDLIYFERPATGTELWQLTLLPVTQTTPTKVASLSNGGEVPVGLDANDTTVAFSTSLTCQTFSQNDLCNVNECNVFAYDIASGTLKTLLSTRQWGCMDAHLADGYVYFTIVGYASRTQHMFGKGIGRVSIADKTFESLNLGIQGDASGPRRIYPQAGRLYLVDPLIMARIDATELDGKMDFTP